MATQTNNPGRGILASATIPAFRLVDANGALCGANANRDMVGVSQEATASGALIPTRLMTAGTLKIAASGAIAKNAPVYKAANGQIGTTNTNAQVGIALEAATAANDIIEVAFTG